MITYVKIILLLLAFGISSYAQTEGDEILINENAIQRPLTLHKHQFRVSSGLYFYILNRQYDKYGNKEMFSEIGKAVSVTNIPFNIKYGLLDFLEIEAGMNYNSTTIRESGLNVINSISPISTKTSYVTKKRGFQDLLILINGRIPGENKKVDFLISSGIVLPIFNSSSLKPEHSAKYFEEEDSEEINYIFNETWNSGAPSFQFGSKIKMRFNKIALIGECSYRFPMKNSQSTYWLYRKVEENFIYSGVKYNFLNPQELFLNLHAQYLLFPWFTTDLEFIYHHHFKGWTELTGKKVAFPSKVQILVNPGFEILVTHRLWLQQRISLTLSGENTIGFTGIETSFLYNLFLK